MKKLFFLLTFISTVGYAQNKKASGDTAEVPAVKTANAFFDDGKNEKASGRLKSADVLPGFMDDNTGEHVSFTKVSKWVDGKSLDDSKVDGIIYRKKGNSFYKRNFTQLTPEMFGAAGDGQKDDGEAFRKLFAFAKSQNLAIIEAASGKTYRLSSPIILDYSREGVVDGKVQFNGNGCKMFLAQGSGGNGWWAFTITTDKTSFQNTKFNFNNITFTCDNVNRPNAVKITGACFATIDNCKFENLGEGVHLESAGMCRVNNCFAWGCVVGFLTSRSKDVYINECHAYGCDWGYRVEGINDFGTDGNVSVTNSVGNACKKFNLLMKGIYTPFISNCVFELAPVNVSIQSCNYGKMSNVFSGPGRFEIIRAPSMLTNDFWNISNIDCQGLVTISSLKFSNISNFKVSGVSNSNNPESTSLLFSDGLKNNITGLVVEDTRTGVKNAVVANADCNIFTWSNLMLDKPILLKGKSGIHVMTCSIINGEVTTGDGTFAKTENLDYLNLADGKKHSIVNGKEMN